MDAGRLGKINPVPARSQAANCPITENNGRSGHEHHLRGRRALIWLRSVIVKAQPPVSSVKRFPCSSFRHSALLKVVHRLVQRARVGKAVNQPNERRGDVWRCVKTCLFINALDEPCWPRPRASRGDADPLALGERRAGVLGSPPLCPPLCPRTGSGPGQRMNLTHGIGSCLNDSITSRLQRRARNSGHLRTGT